MARYRIDEFKYYYNDTEITVDEYFTRLCTNAAQCGYKVNKTLVRKAIAEDRHTAWIVGNQETYLKDGGTLRIVRD